MSAGIGIPEMVIIGPKTGIPGAMHREFPLALFMGLL
jgi:hypothetical protein